MCGACGGDSGPTGEWLPLGGGGLLWLHEGSELACLDLKAAAPDGLSRL